MEQDAATPPFAVGWRDVGARLNPLTAVGVRESMRKAYLSLAGRLVGFAREPFVRCLYLHYVFADQAADFRRIISALKEIGRFITTPELHRFLRGEQPIRERCFHLSFDDGFENMITHAGPVLRDLNVPALFFVPSAHMGVSDQQARANWRGWGWPACPVRPMTWDGVIRLRDMGFEIGSHTRSHARLSDWTHDAARLKDEIEGSKRELEQQLGQPCRYFSWPFGLARDISPLALKMIEAAGYELCFSAIRGSIVPGRTSPFQVPRHHFEPEWPWSHVRYFAAGRREAA